MDPDLNMDPNPDSNMNPNPDTNLITDSDPVPHLQIISDPAGSGSTRPVFSPVPDRRCRILRVVLVRR